MHKLAISKSTEKAKGGKHYMNTMTNKWTGYLPVSCVKDSTISTPKYQARTIRDRMCYSNRFNFKWASNKSLSYLECFKPRWNKDPEFLQTLFYKLLKTKSECKKLKLSTHSRTNCLIHREMDAAVLKRDHVQCGINQLWILYPIWYHIPCHTKTTTPPQVLCILS